MADKSERFLAWLLSAAVSAACPNGSGASDPLPNGLGEQNVAIEFSTENGWAYDGRIELPAKDLRNGYAVMMLGGGLGSPIDWAVPGVMTLDGKPTRDGDTIAEALLEAGFIVMRWQSIRRGDPKHAEDPVMMDPPPYPQTIEQAKKAYAAFREKKVVPDERIFLLGHSLGARRAAILIEENPKTPGVVMLAGASLLPSDLEAARKLMAEAEEDWKTWPRDELAQDLARDYRREMHDYVAARFDRDSQWPKPVDDTKDKHGFRWAAAVIAEYQTPTFSLVGAGDERWLLECHMFSSYLRGKRLPDYTWKVYDGLGHQLAPDVPGAVEYKDQGVISQSRTGPIRPYVVKDIVDWLIARVKTP